MATYSLPSAFRTLPGRNSCLFPPSNKNTELPFGLGNQQGVARVVVAGDFLAFGQGFADDGVVFAFKDFARALCGFCCGRGCGREAEENGEKLGFDYFS